jgi:ketosteroid isomerase-like protein
VSANLDLVRSIHTAFERGDFSSSEWADPEIEFVRPDGPAPASWKGVAGLAEGAREQLEPWQGYRIEVDGYHELDGERVLVLYHRSGRGKTSGLEVGRLQSRGAHVFHVRDGKVTRLVAYLDHRRALADLGLKE